MAVEFFSKSENQPFFLNPYNGMTYWSKPEIGKPLITELPNCWSQQKSSKGKLYYYCDNTGVSQWNLPTSIKIRGNVYNSRDKNTDYKYLIQNNINPKTLYLFNDNVEHHKTAISQSGNAAVRNYNIYGRGINKAVVAGISTGEKQKGFSRLTPRVKSIIDDEFREVQNLLDTDRFDEVVYSSSKDGGLATQIFTPSDDVKDYIIAKLYTLKGPGSQVDFKDDVQDIIKDNPGVVMISKKGCSSCMKAKKLLEDNSVKLTILETDDQVKEILDDVTNLYKPGYKTYPRLFHDGKFIGGYDDLKKINLDTLKN